MKVFSAYKTIDKPWGGANNFLRALWQEMYDCYGITFVEDPGKADIAFFNQMSAGPGSGSKKYQWKDIKKIRKTNASSKIVIRAINLDKLVGQLPWWKYYLGVGFRKDRNAIKALQSADCIIYQSQYQKKLYDSCGIKPKMFRIIHNGAARSFSAEATRPVLLEDQDLIILSVSFSTGKYKRHDYIAEISKIPGVKVLYAGSWPENVNPQKTILQGVVDHTTLLELMRQAHYLFHPSVHDVCPNTLLESLYAGMPVIYNSALETGLEIAGIHGIPYNPDNPMETILFARNNYKKMIQALSFDKTKYGIERAAEDYYDLFTTLKEDKNG
jgi:glycosyltransferase involved in cell wall biosynthesis